MYEIGLHLIRCESSAAQTAVEYHNHNNMAKIANLFEQILTSEKKLINKLCNDAVGFIWSNPSPPAPNKNTVALFKDSMPEENKIMFARIKDTTSRRHKQLTIFPMPNTCPGNPAYFKEFLKSTAAKGKS